MSAVIRLKRHIDEEPYNAFVLNCKKRKVDGQSTREETSTVLKFAGTVSQDTDINAHINRITKDEAKEILSKTHRSDLTEKGRQESRAHAQSSRFKIVNCSRNLDAMTEATPDDKKVTIVDVEKENVAPSVVQPRVTDAPASEENFVYDLYIADVDSFQSPEIIIDDISVVAYGEYIYTTHRGDEGNLASDDSEDSNDENNWRNDYPEEEDNSSIDENDMRAAMERCDLDGANELSSSDDEFNQEDSDRNGFVYSIDAEAIGFEDDLDYCDVARYGEAYARYKRRVLKHVDHDYTLSTEDGGSDEDEDRSENSNEYYYTDND